MKKRALSILLLAFTFNPALASDDIAGVPGLLEEAWQSALMTQIWSIILVGGIAAALTFFAWRKPIEGCLSILFLATAILGDWLFSMLALPFPPANIPVIHIAFWAPVLALLLLWRPFFDSTEGRGFRAWSAVMTALIVCSFVFDMRDAASYVNPFI